MESRSQTTGDDYETLLQSNVARKHHFHLSALHIEKNAIRVPCSIKHTGVIIGDPTTATYASFVAHRGGNFLVISAFVDKTLRAHPALSSIHRLQATTAPSYTAMRASFKHFLRN